MPGFYKLAPAERASKVAEFAGLSKAEREALAEGGLTLKQADSMIENVVGTFSLPLAVAVNFQVNGKDYVVPMATEEPSVVAAASNMAKAVRESGGFKTSSTEPVMEGQIQLVDVKDPEGAVKKILKKKKEILELANKQDSVLVKFKGGARDLKVGVVKSAAGSMVVAHLHVDVRDAMGANAVNTMCEAVAPLLEQLSGGRSVLKIITNYAKHRLARAECTLKAGVLGGGEVVDNIVWAQALADNCKFRATTHNKGVMNGVTAVVLATGNDSRAIEAGAHAYAARDGKYRPLTSWSKTKGGDLKGSIELPMAVGIVGGSTKVHPTAQLALKILGVKSARELGEVAAAVGLAQNLAALRALATEGIQKGHMRLHARKK